MTTSDVRRSDENPADEASRSEEARSRESAGDAKKSYATILDQEISEGLEELERPAGGLLLSGLSAGLDVGFSALLVFLVVTLAKGQIPDPFFEILKANAYTVGFIFVIFGRSELFTEHTTLACWPVLDGRASVAQLGRLWGLVYVSNLVGAALFSGLLVVIGPALGIIETTAFESVAAELTGYPAWVILLSAVLAGWLMGLVSWLVTAGRDTISQIFFVWLVTGSIGIAKLHHCIVGTVEVLPAVLAGTGVTLAQFSSMLVLATVGNMVGGVFFVALIKYVHAQGARRGMMDPQTWQSPD